MRTRNVDKLVESFASRKTDEKIEPANAFAWAFDLFIRTSEN